VPARPGKPARRSADSSRDGVWRPVRLWWQPARARRCQVARARPVVPDKPSPFPDSSNQAATQSRLSAPGALPAATVLGGSSRRQSLVVSHSTTAWTTTTTTSSLISDERRTFLEPEGGHHQPESHHRIASLRLLSAFKRNPLSRFIGLRS